jgi:CBS domain-containing protein
MVEPRVEQLMSRPVETVAPETSIHDAADELVRHDVGAVVVVDEAAGLEGLLRATDFVLMVRDGTAAPGSAVAEVMRTDVLTTTPDALVSELAETMLERRVTHVPVLEGAEVVGMVSTTDLAAYLARSP